ncbi:MAG: peptidase U32 family protein [Syntrophomonadaceae bacterium]|jgi:putative protease
MLDHEIELLAPAGKWDVMQSVARAGADAVYLGGKKFNMRMLKSDFNFTDNELEQAVDFLHAQGKKLYVTVNNLYNDNEIEELKDYLLFLNDIKVDALIVQDLGVVDLHHELGLGIDIHGSVQMGVGNSQAVKFLQNKGLSRIILSKNVSLQEISAIHKATDMVLEYFAHGDLCVSHTGQCYMSYLFLGESSNRGRCKKPCRWKYRVEGNGLNTGYRYVLANKDLCLYAHLADLARAGVSSFKIEGRMRTAEYVAFLIRTYREALDRVIDNINTYQVDEAALTELNLHRVRDYTTGNLLARPGIESIGLTGEREPFFPTTTVKAEPLKKEDYYQDSFAGSGNIELDLTVKVGSIESLHILNHGVTNIIVGMDTIRQGRVQSSTALLDEALKITEKSKIFLETPRIVTEDDLPLLRKYLNGLRLDRLDGFIVNDYGSLNLIMNSGLGEKEIWAGPGLNIINCRAGRILQENGIARLSAPLEIDLDGLQTIAKSGIPVEVTVHGPLCAIITDLCLPRAVNCQDGECTGYCQDDHYFLVDEYEQKYRISTDSNCRNYIFYPYDLCLLSYIPALNSLGVKSLRIEGQYYSEEILEQVVAIYSSAVKELKQGLWKQEDNYNRLLDISPRGLTTTPLVNNLASRGSLIDYRHGNTQSTI